MCSVNHYTVLLAPMVLNIMASAETVAAILAAAIAMPAALSFAKLVEKDFGGFTPPPDYD
jgi:cobalamin synthase